MMDGLIKKEMLKFRPDIDARRSIGMNSLDKRKPSRIVLHKSHLLEKLLIDSTYKNIKDLEDEINEKLYSTERDDSIMATSIGIQTLLDRAMKDVTCTTAAIPWFLEKRFVSDLFDKKQMYEYDNMPLEMKNELQELVNNSIIKDYCEEIQNIKPVNPNLIELCKELTNGAVDEHMFVRLVVDNITNLFSIYSYMDLANSLSEIIKPGSHINELQIFTGINIKSFQFSSEIQSAENVEITFSGTILEIENIKQKEE